MYCSAPYVEEFCARIAAEATAIAGHDYEVVLVNDGSPDDALNVALTEQKKNPRIRVVDLSRNFGHHPAIITGLRQARGDYVFLIDIDLEEPPELLGEFWHTLNSEADIDVVGGIQVVRLGTATERYAGDFAWRLMRKMSSTDLPVNTLIARIMTRRFIDALMNYDEKLIFFSAICADMGFQQRFIPVQKTDTSETTYTLPRKLKLMFNGITATSTRPLLLSLFVSLGLAAITALIGIYVMVTSVLGFPLPGWAPIVLAVTAATTILTCLQGIHGIYLAHLFTEVKGRPVAIVRKIHECENRSE
jgi:putative glycosyltransferase